jgi:hypothetical protein
LGEVKHHSLLNLARVRRRVHSRWSCKPILQQGETKGYHKDGECREARSFFHGASEVALINAKMVTRGM